MATSLFSVGGLISGLDTNTIIQRLMDAERAPLARLDSRRATYQSRVDAWGAVKSRLSAVMSKAEALDVQSDFESFARVSSSSETVKASISGAVTPGTLSFTVDRLAQTHQTASTTAFATTNDTVGAGTFTITLGGTDYAFATTASTTLDLLAEQINASGSGVKASIISPDGSSFKLVLTSESSGIGNRFTTSATQVSLATFGTTQTGEDSQLTIGSGVDAITVTRSSNVISDLMPGLTLTLTALSATPATPVTVDVQRDVDASIAAIKGLVDEVNKAINALNELTKYDSVTQRSGILQGDSTAWGLESQLHMVVSDTVSGLTGIYTSASSVGITLQRDATYKIDETKLRAALNDAPDAVGRLFSRSGSAVDPRLEFLFSGDMAKAGSYNVQITTAAERATVIGTAYVAPAADEVLSITSGNLTANVTITSGSTLAQAVSTINSALSAVGIKTLSASEDAGAIRLSETRYGSSIKFTVASDDSFSLNGTFAGVNVAGVINGVAATGTGQVLRSDAGDSESLQVLVKATAAEVTAAGGSLDLGALTYTNGVAGRVKGMVGLATAARGIITVAGERWTSQIKLVTDQMTRFEERMVRKEETLRRQFVAMESAMSKLSSQANWLASQVAAQSQQ